MNVFSLFFFVFLNLKFLSLINSQSLRASNSLPGTHSLTTTHSSQSSTVTHSSHPLTTTHSSSSHSSPIHLVFVGDSLLRYSFLDFIYRIHFHQPPSWSFTYNDHKERIKWTTYLKQSTDIFNGSMRCDCYRGDIMGRSDEIFETRYYRHPSGQFYATYYQKWGNVPVYGKKNFQDIKVYDTLQEAQRDTWMSPTFESLVLNQIRPLFPPVTAVIMNQRFWVAPFRKTINIIPEMKPMMTALFSFVDIILWLEGTPTQSESKTKQLEYNPIDDYIKSTLCNVSNPNHVEKSFISSSTMTMNSINLDPIQSQNKEQIEIQKNINQQTTQKGNQHLTCYFVPFPSSLRKVVEQDPDSYYGDQYHFVNNTAYHIRLFDALKSVGLEGVYNLPLSHHHNHPHPHS